MRREGFIHAQRLARMEGRTAIQDLKDVFPCACRRRMIVWRRGREEVDGEVEEVEEVDGEGK